MGEPFQGEIRMFGGNFAPAGWAFCNGQSVPISENNSLFILIGTTYGGDGETTFNLPNLQSRIPIHAGQGPGISQNYQLGEMGGVESVTLTIQQTPVHSHPFLASTAAASSNSPANQVIAQSGQRAVYTEDTTTTNLASTSIGIVGGSQPHENRMSYTCISFIISLFGVYPQQ